MNQQNNPELGRILHAGGLETNIHDLNPDNQGVPVMLIHGSGPGVSAWANWRLILPKLAESRRVIAPDMAGFGYTERKPNATYSLDIWVEQLAAIQESLAINQIDLVGNSFGGALALAYAIRYPNRVRRLVLMGSVGVSFPITAGLDAVWGYTPSIESMRQLLDIFAYDRSLVNDELAKLRYVASIRAGVQESFSAMFPAPRQRWVDAMASDEADIRQLPHETLVIHGREDKVIPLNNSYVLSQWIPRAQLHVYPQCGHWTQIEHANRFAKLVDDFLSEGTAAEPRQL